MRHETILHDIQSNLKTAQEKMAKYANQQRRPHETFKPGTHFGPFEVEWTKDVNCKLKLPLHLSRLHPVIYAKLLKKYVSNNTENFPLERPIVEEPHIEPETDGLFDIENVLERRITQRRARKYSEYLIKWLGYDTCDNTWEPRRNIPHAFDDVIERLRAQ